jgi:lysophospholipase L1-like esterase
VCSAADVAVAGETTIAGPSPRDDATDREAEADPLAKLGIEKNDTFIFLGDSITFGCGWTQHVENYFYTRFPETRIRFVNAAVGGDRSWTVEERFDQSIAPLRPRFATIMLGMNDGRYPGLLAKKPEWDTNCRRPARHSIANCCVSVACRRGSGSHATQAELDEPR